MTGAGVVIGLHDVTCDANMLLVNQHEMVIGRVSVGGDFRLLWLLGCVLFPLFVCDML